MINDVVCIDITKYSTDNLTGYMQKPFSILYSSFQEVIYIDADNISVFDPEELFEMDSYRETGSIFWKDYWETAKNNPIWDITKTDYTSTKEQESGQLVVKKKCWRALNLCNYFNLENELYYKLLHGDKDTFRFAWLCLKMPLNFIDKEPDICGYKDQDGNFFGITMVQYNNDYIPYFLHRNLLKWDITANDEFS